jgi:hypothetical protein
MQSAEKQEFVENNISEIEKLKRVAEIAIQLKDTYRDVHASYGEKEYVLEKLEESLEEYESFLDGY